MAIPTARFDIGGYGASIVFMVVAALMLALAALTAVWAVRARQPLGAALGLIFLGLSVAMSYEAAAVWVHQPWLKTISRITNDAFNTNQALWGVIFFTIILIVGLLTMHFTRLATRPEDPEPGAEWSLLGTAVLVMLNGSLFAFWFKWLP